MNFVTFPISIPGKKRGVWSSYSQQSFPVVSRRNAVSCACPHPVCVTLWLPPTALFWSTGWMNEFFSVVIKALLVRPSRDIVSCLLAQGQSTWWVGADKTDRVLFALCWVYELIIWAHSALSRVPKETVGLCDSCIINHWLLFIQKSQISLV